MPRLSEIRCMGCGQWFSSRDSACECGWERPAYNAGLVSARWASGLYAQASRALSEDARYKQSLAEEVRMAKRYGIEPAPMSPSPLGPAEAKILRA